MTDDVEGRMQRVDASLAKQLSAAMATNGELLEALKETVLQLQYLADKFGETGTGAAVLARVNASIAKAEGRG